MKLSTVEAAVGNRSDVMPRLGTIEGMDTAACYCRGAAGAMAIVEILRLAPNDWGLAVVAYDDAPTDPDREPPDVRSHIRASATRRFGPSEVLNDLSAGLLADPASRTGRFRSIVFARIELDLCGAWVTLANVGDARPIVVRKAGWIDLRGQAAAFHPSGRPLDLRDDRIGLGPGDALLICTDAIAQVRNSDGTAFQDEALPNLLLGAIGRDAEEMANRTVAEALAFGTTEPSGDGVVMVVQVPEIQRGHALERVAAATGLPAGDLCLPGYPLGDVQPDRQNMPNPPREARMNLAPEPRSVPALRRLVRRLVQSWRLAGEDNLDLLVSEVATNVFASSTAAVVTVIVRHDGRLLRCEIGDRASSAAPRRVPGYDELSGPSLMLVDALASAWGVLRTGSGQGLWFEVPAVPQAEG